MLNLGVSAWGLADRHRMTAFDGGGKDRPAERDSQGFLAVGGFDEVFPAAAGEDIELGLRMYASGRIRFVEGAICWHSFEEDLDKFVRRLERYGAGTRVLAEKHGRSLDPRPFVPNRPTRMNWTLARVQYEALLRGYRMVDAPQPPGVAITVP